MRVIIYLLFAAASAQADQIRRTKLPYIADAVGNSLPPPSSGPASVGSPVKLLSPDKYEFYTFDESGELVKRLMTLEEIQAIVAAGEETDGLVTFANDNLPTITFNFSQPSQTKVHNVVTNVQNVLKAQMEAHKNKPYVQPTLDTPDVSDSWSLILPSIFGNTGVDIVPDKLSGSFITPETETIEINNLNNEYDNSQSKESNDIPTVASTVNKEPINKSSTNIPSTTSGSTSSKTPITTTTQKSPPTTTTQKPTSTTTTQKPTSTTTTQKSPSTTTTQNPPLTTPKRLTTTTQKPSSTTTTQKITTTKIPLDTKPPYKPKTTTKPLLILTSTEPPIVLSTVQTSTAIKNNITPPKNMATKVDLQLNQSSYKNKNETTTSSFSINNKPYEDENKYVPVSTVSYITESTTNKVIFNNKHTILSNKIPSEITKISMNTTTNIPILIEDKETEKQNSTTITTQSVSPSTSVPSTELISTQKHHTQSDIVPKNPIPTMNSVNDNEDTIIPMFDVAQSLSQIASDLSGNFTPVPTSSSLLDTTPQSNVEIESKESLEIDIPTESTNENESKENNTDVRDHFIKISTFNPDGNSQNNTSKINAYKNTPIILNLSSTTPSSASNNIDPLLSESMDNLFSQVANEDPDSTTVVISKNRSPSDDVLITETSFDSTTNNIVNLDTTTEKYDPEVTPNLPISGNSEKDKNKKINNHQESPILSSASTNTKLEKEKDLLLTTLKPEINNNVILETPTPLNSSTSKSEVNLTTKPNDNVSTNKQPSTTTEKIETTKSTRKNIPVANIINTTVPPKDFNEHNKISNKQHKISEELPKIEDFKKKIQKVNIDDKELANERNNSWKLIPTVVKLSDLAKDKQKIEGFYTPESNDKDIILEFPKENQGLEVTTKDLGEDIMQFTELSNELAFRYWNIMVEKIDKKRSMVFSPYSITSMLAMMFMGAKGATSGEMNEVLKLDDMVTFNPHFTLKNISDSIETTSSSGVAVSAFIRELYSERNKGKILTFYKERAQHFYNGHVEEVNFKLISDIIRRRTNLLVKRYTWGKIPEYMKTNSITMNPPLAAFAANIFYTDCSGSSVDGRDGEMYFVVSPSVRQRRLVPVPSVVYRSNFLAGYDPVLDATAAALGNTESIVSTLFLMPGQQGNVVHTDDLENLEKRLIKAEVSTPAWNRLLRTLLPRIGLELQIPRFSHKSIFNVTSTLQRMELKDLFSEDHADLGGLNGPSKDLHLSDMIQQTSFVTCGEDVIGEQHHIEEYPDTIEIRPKRRTSRWNTGWAEPRDYQRAFHDPHDVGEAMHLPLHLRPRQARVPARSSQPARLKFDRPFLYFVRHNPSGMILYVGRYNPRLLP